MLGRVAANLLQTPHTCGIQLCRSIGRIPHYEHHIRFDPKIGRKRPSLDVLDRFKRLNNGMWIRTCAGRNKQRYAKNELFEQTTYNYETCTEEECQMLDRMMTPFWRRPKHYVDDPYELYHVRHGINTPRVDYKGRLVRERQKVLLDDTTSDKFFFDR